MGFRRLNIAVDCENPKEMEQAQIILDELSTILRLNAKDLIKSAPMIRKNQSVIFEIFKTISTGGAKSIASIIPLAFKIKK